MKCKCLKTATLMMLVGTLIYCQMQLDGKSQ